MYDTQYTWINTNVQARNQMNKVKIVFVKPKIIKNENISAYSTTKKEKTLKKPVKKEKIEKKVKSVIEKKKSSRVAEEVINIKTPTPDTKAERASVSFHVQNFENGRVSFQQQSMLENNIPADTQDEEIDFNLTKSRKSLKKIK